VHQLIERFLAKLRAWLVRAGFNQVNIDLLGTGGGNFPCKRGRRTA
jgi:hypothetical protein